jgi:hypothetical protein
MVFCRTIKQASENVFAPSWTKANKMAFFFRRFVENATQLYKLDFSVQEMLPFVGSIELFHCTVTVPLLFS